MGVEDFKYKELIKTEEGLEFLSYITQIPIEKLRKIIKDRGDIK